MKKIAFTCGGTGGHVYPAIAVAQEFKPEQVYFIGSPDREDFSTVPKYGYKYYSTPSSNKNPLSILRAFIRSRIILSKEKTDILIGAGGYHTFPVVLAAWSLRIPIVLLEQNAIPGRVNRYLSRFSNKVCLTFKESLKYFPSKKRVLTGNPVRKSFPSNSTPKEITDLTSSQEKKVLVFGGSQGSHAINDIFKKEYRYFLNNNVSLIHITGPSYYQKHYETQPFTVLKNDDCQSAIYIFPYFDNIDLLYEMSDMVVSRAGATSIAELLHFNKKALLIPYPYAKDDHQTANAKAFKSAGMGDYCDQSNFTFNTFLDMFHVKQHAQPVLNFNSRKRVVKEIEALLGEQKK